jgi:serine/threonine protein kinase
MGSVLSTCAGDPSKVVDINGKRYVIDKLLGEGGFSYVYLVIKHLFDTYCR